MVGSRQPGTLSVGDFRDAFTHVIEYILLMRLFRYPEHLLVLPGLTKPQVIKVICSRVLTSPVRE